MSSIQNLASKPNKVSTGLQNLRTAGALSHKNQTKIQQPLLRDKKKKPLLINDNVENIGSIQKKVISKLPLPSNKNKALAKMKNLQQESRIPLNSVQAHPNQQKEIPSTPEEPARSGKTETPVNNNQDKIVEKSPPSSGSNELLARMDKIINSMKAKHKPKQIDFLTTPKQASENHFPSTLEKQNLVIPNELFSNEIASDLKTQISMEKEEEEDNSKVIVIFEDTGAGSDEALATQQIKGINDIELLSSSSANSSVHKTSSEKLGKKLKKKHLSMLRFLSSKSHNKSILSIESSKEDPIVTAFNLNSPSPQHEIKTVTSSLVNIQDLRSTIHTSIQNMEENFIQAKNNFFTALNSYMEEKNNRENPKISLKRVPQNRLSLKKTASKAHGKITESAKKIGALNSTPKNFKRLTPKSSCSPTSTPCNQNLQDSLNEVAPQQIPVKKERIFAEEDQISKSHIKSVVMKNFVTSNNIADEMTCIQKVVNKQSCIYRAERKALVYQTCSLILKGVVIYVHSSVSYMAEQIQQLPDSLSGVCINNMMSHDKIEEALDLLRSDQIKILYITPDKLVSSQLFQALPTLEIALICFDEAHSIPELSCNYKPIFYSLYKALKNQLRFIPVLALVAPCTYKTCKQLSELLHVPSENIVPQDFSYNGPAAIAITRDEDKMKSLLNLFKTQSFKDLKHSLIYTDCARLADEVAAILSENGYKTFNYHSAKTEYQKIDVLNSFTKSPQGVLLATSITGMGINKNLIKGVIYYSMPRSIEHFAQDLSCFSEKSTHHMFLHEEDYHRMRFSLISETLEEEQIASFLSRILSKISSSEKEKAMKMSGMDSLLSGFVKMKESVAIEEEKEDTDKLHAVKVVDICKELELTKEFIIQIFEKVEENDRWLEYYGVTPTNYTIKFTPEALEARLPHDPLLQTILHYSKKSETQTYKLNVLNLVNHTEYSVPELFKKLKELQQAKLLSFSSYDESFCFKVLYQPNPKTLNNLVNIVYEKLSKRNLFNLQKLDFMYAASKISSYQSLEHFAKQSKLGNHKRHLKPLGNHQSVENSSCASNSTPSKLFDLVEMEKSQINNKGEKIKAGIVAMFEKYLNFKDELNQGIETLWDGQNSLETELPLIKIQTQREKSNFTTDIQPLIAELYEEMIYLQFSSDFNHSQGVNFIVQRLKCKIMKILQGINFEEISCQQSLHEKNNENSTESKYKRFKEKYYKYSMQDLSLLISDAVNTFIAAKEFNS